MIVYLLYFLNFLYISSFKGFTCRKLSFLNDVQILPDNCVLYNQRYGSICSFSCATGKQISGPSSVRCGIRGYWSEEVNEVSCNGSYNSNFCFVLLFTLVFLLMFQAALKNNGKDVVKELKLEVTGYVTSTRLVCQIAWTLATWVKTLYTKTLRAVKTSPQWFFLWAPVQMSNFLLSNLILQLSTRKRLTFESIKSDISNLGRPMRTWEFRLRSDVDWFFMCRT